VFFRRNYNAEQIIRHKAGICDMHVFSCRTGRGWKYVITCDVRTGMWSASASRTDIKNPDMLFLGNGEYRTRAEVEALCNDHLKKELCREK
jgi:hypothetical protein